MTYARPGRISRLALLLLSAAAVPLLAQDKADIYGQVRIAGSGEIPARVPVSLNSRGMVAGQTFTDEHGRFEFRGLPGNPYFIVINHEGYQPVNERVRIDPHITDRQFVNIVLYPRTSKTVEGSPSPASGGNPHVVDVAEYTRKFPKDVRKEFEKGVKAEKKGKTDDAIEHYEKVIAQAPNFYPARNNLGILYLDRKNVSGAAREFEAAIRLNPNDAFPYLNMGKLHLMAGRLPEAESWVQQGLQRQPDAAFGHFLLGTIQSQTSRPAEAETSLKRAIELDAQIAPAYLQLVNLYLQEQRNADAIAELNRFVMQFPDDPQVQHANQVLKKLEGTN